MATQNWQGISAAAVAQATDYVLAGTWEATDVITCAFANGKSFSMTAGSTVAATIAASLATAWNALDATLYPEFAKITASVPTGATFRLTHDDEGVPFTVTISTTDAGGAADAQTIDGAASSTGTDSTACAGPYFWSKAANWTSAVPANGDTVNMEFSDAPAKYGLAQSAVTVAALNIPASFIGEVGLPRVNSDGTPYIEHRARYLAIGATLLNIGHGEGEGSRRLMIDNSSIQTTAVVRRTSSPADQDAPAVCWKGTHASNAVEVVGGSFGAAVFGGEVATIATLRVGASGDASDARFLGGAGLSLTTLNQLAGEVELNAGLTTVTKTGGRLVLNAGNVTTLTERGGGTAYNGIGTIGTLNLSGLIDFSGEMRACTVTNCNLYRGAVLFDPHGRVTFTNPPQLVDCALDEVTINVGRNRTVQFG